MSRLIFHITTASEWQAARREGAYLAASLDSEGFIHCSLPTQVNHVADWFYRDIPDLVLLCIDPQGRLVTERDLRANQRVHAIAVQEPRFRSHAGSRTEEDR